MKRSIKLFITILTVLLLSTGCVKYETSMTIGDDNSIKYSTLVGYNKKDLNKLIDMNMEDASVKDQFKVTDELVKEYKKSGILVSEYEDDDFIGISLLKTYDSIDDISTGVATECEIDLYNKKIDNIYCFQKVNGLFFDTYKAKISTKTFYDGMYVNSNLPTEEDFRNQNNITDEEYNTSYDPETNSYTYTSKDGSKTLTYTEPTKTREDVEDIPASMMEDASIKFILNTKNKITKSNAAKVENDGKKLVWDFLDDEHKVDYIEFEYQKPKYIWIGLGIGAAILVGMLTIGLIISSMNKNIEDMKKRKEELDKQKLQKLEMEQVETIEENPMINSLLAPDTTTPEATNTSNTTTQEFASNPLFEEEDDEPIDSDIYE